jgi:peptidoglycan/xylan/chitin deacetylase (PgdA/CDA1 family)
MIPFSTKFKILIAYIFYYTGVSYLFFRISLFLGGFRVINYHCTPSFEKNKLEYQFKFYKKYFNNFDLSHNNFKNKSFSKSNLILTFDDGLRSNFDVALPLLDKYNFTGIFFISTNFIYSSLLTDLNNANIYPKQLYTDNRNTLNVEEIKIIHSKHIVGSHTTNHFRFGINDTLNTLEHEIIDSKKVLNYILNTDINSFAWVGGEYKHYTKEALNLIKNNYKFIFSTNTKINFTQNKYYNIGRLNIESCFTKQLFLFQMSGIIDLLYLIKQFKLYNKIYKHG